MVTLPLKNVSKKMSDSREVAFPPSTFRKAIYLNLTVIVILKVDDYTKYAAAPGANHQHISSLATIDRVFDHAIERMQFATAFTQFGSHGFEDNQKQRDLDETERYRFALEQCAVEHQI